MEQVPFTLSGTPTGFPEGDVVVHGRFLYEFDDDEEKLLSHSAVVDDISRDEFLADTGILYKFSTATVDTSTLRVLQDHVGGSKAFLDTVQIEVRLVSTYNDVQGMVHDILDTADLERAGNRYYVPPLP